MLIDVVNQYDEEKKEFLLDLRKKIVNQLIKKEDIKKIISFLNKCWIIGIDDKKKHIYLWVPNEFVATQVKKFFNKKLNETISEIFNPQFKIKIQIFPPFQSWRHPLQLNLIKFLKIKKSENKKIDLDKDTKEKLTEFFGILFDKRFKFSNFVVWSNNKLAFVAAKKVAENPGKVYNPLFIWWNVWLGKTHLLQAIWNYIIEHYPEKVVIYFPTTKFIDEVVEAIRKNKLNFFIDKLNQIDVLILDDIQFLWQKEKTQEIFHNIFNELYNKQKQIVLSSDQPPKMLNSLEKRLTSRFAMWLVVDIQKPDFETRLAILLEKLKEKWENLDKEILNLIAETITDNIRELEWALNVILTRKNLLGEDLTIEEVKNILKSLWYNVDNYQKTVQTQTKVIIPAKKDLNYYLEIISQYYNLDPREIKWNSRKKEISLARQMLMYIWKRYLNRTLERIWDFFGGKNHATVIYAINNFEKLLKQDENIKQDFNWIIQN
jgi:chromosomal replication initiator protein